jgi:hypothetical protein
MTKSGLRHRNQVTDGDLDRTLSESKALLIAGTAFLVIIHDFVA